MTVWSPLLQIIHLNMFFRDLEITTISPMMILSHHFLKSYLTLTTIKVSNLSYICEFYGIYCSYKVNIPS